MAPDAFGAVVEFETVIETDFVAVTPPESVARAEIVCAPLASAAVFSVADQLCVPVAAAYAPPSTDTSIFDTLTSSDAVPVIAIEPLTVAPESGAVIVTTGA